jgi:hypothetical protein
MATNTTFANAGKLPVTGSIYPIGTAFLRNDPGTNFNDQWIAVGKTEKIGIKTTGAELELEDEEGATEAFIMMNNGEDVSLTARFTRDVPSPVRGQFITISRRKVTLSQGTLAFSAVATNGGKAAFTMVSTSGYAIGDLITVVTSTVTSYKTTAAVLSLTATALTLDIPVGATATGTLSAPPALTAVFQVVATVLDTFLITDVAEDYGSKEVAKYTLTARKWDSISNVSSAVSNVTTATNQLLSKDNVPL